METEKLKGVDFFRPESFLLFYLIFILIATASFFSGLPIKKPSLLSFAVIFAAFPFFLLGIRAGKYFYAKKIPQFLIYVFVALISIFYSLVFANFFKFDIIFSLILCTVLFAFLYLVIKKKQDVLCASKKIPIVLTLLGGVFLFFAFFQEKGAPLLNSALKVNFLYNTFFGIAMLIFLTGFTFLMPQIKDKRKFFIILIIGTLLFLFSAFRGIILMVFLTGAFIAYYSRKLDNRKIFLALIAAFLIILFVGYVARPILNPAELLLYRAGTTHNVFDNIVQKSMPFGYTHGTLFFSGNPRDFVGMEIMGKQANLTYTILGAAVLDFGIIGAVLWMFLLGAILKLAHLGIQRKGLEGFYPLLFSISLVFIEIGVDPFFLLFFFVFLLFYIKDS